MVIFPELFNGPETTVLTEGPQIEARGDERLGNADTPTASPRCHATTPGLLGRCRSSDLLCRAISGWPPLVSVPDAVNEPIIYIYLSNSRLYLSEQTHVSLSVTHTFCQLVRSRSIQIQIQ